MTAEIIALAVDALVSILIPLIVIGIIVAKNKQQWKSILGIFIILLGIFPILLFNHITPDMIVKITNSTQGAKDFGIILFLMQTAILLMVPIMKTQICIWQPIR